MSPTLSVCMHISSAFRSYERGRFKNATSSQAVQARICVCVCVCAHIDFPTRLFTAKGKLWLERKERARERQRQRERGGQTENSLHLVQWWACQNTHTHADTHRGTNTPMQTLLFSCFVLFSFHGHKQYLTNQHPDNIRRTHGSALRHTHAHEAHVKVWDRYID